VPETVKKKSKIASDTRVRILDAAAALFREKGFAAVSLRGIADAAQMKAGSVYYHFKSKEEIVLEVLNIGIERVHVVVADVFETHQDGASADLVRACIKAHLTALLAHSDYASANVRIQGQVPDGVRQDAMLVRREYENLWDQILDVARGKGGLREGVNLRLFRLSLIGALNATLEWFDPENGDVEQLGDAYADILMNGLMGT
jgi:TetR/AcrR family transcriptional regulator, cholesterol catabolism regulator